MDNFRNFGKMQTNAGKPQSFAPFSRNSHVAERETDLSDFARPPEKPPRAEKARFGTY